MFIFQVVEHDFSFCKPLLYQLFLAEDDLPLASLCPELGVENIAFLFKKFYIFLCSLVLFF
jgi:hypothetical protein